MAEKIILGKNGNFGVKEGGTLAYNDENGVFKAIELASSRSSSATYVAESGLIADAEVGVPRIDWTNGVGELLLEPASTNKLNYSEDFSLWTLNGDSVVNTGTTAFGKSIWRVTESSSSSLGVVNTFLASGLVQTTISVLAKANTSNNIILRYGASNNKNLSVDLSDGSITSSDVGVTGRVKDMGNGWYLISSTITLTNTTVDVAIYTSLGAIDVIYAQAEELSYPTSYIRTSGSAVTRIADAVTGNSSLGQVINSSEGVLYVEMSALADIDSIRLLELNDNNSTNRVYFYFRNSSGANPNRIFTFVVSGGSTVFSSVQTLPLSASVLDSNKFAIKWKLNDFALWINGTEIDTGTGVSPLNLSRLSFSDYLGNLPFYGRIRDLRVYDTALTDAELTTLTTI